MQFCMRALRRVVLTSVALVLAMFVVPAAHGQAGAVTGTVVDAKTGLPLADAQVQIEGADTRTRTNIKGEFRLAGVTGSPRLVVTRVGYQPITIPATVDGPALRVALNEYAVKLDEVIVTGTAGDSRARTLGNVIGKVDVSATLERAPLPKMQDALSVNIPGVRVMRSSGQIGSGGVTRIRGAGSLSLSNEPLIFVDGVRVNNQGATANEASGVSSSPSRINDFNPEDIESIEVLKGPSAATIYGTEASNGVIQITTKRGRTGRPTFDIHMDAGANWLSNPVERYGNNYYYSKTSGEVRPFSALKFNQDEGIVCAPIEKAGCNPFSTGTPMALGASLNGGSEAVRYHISGDYARDEGAVDYNWQNKFSGRANISYSSPKFQVDASMGMIRSKLRGASTAQPITTSILWSCNFPGCEPGTNGPSDLGWNGPGHGYQFYRPEDYYGVEGFDNVDRTTLSIRLTHRPNSWFRHNLTVGPDYLNDKSTSLFYRDPGYHAFFANSDGAKTARQLRTTYLTVDYGAAADIKPFDNWVFTTSVGAQYYYKQFDEVVGQGTVFSIPGPSDITGATNRTAVENFLENKTLGVYAQEQIAYKDRLFLTAAVRADDNSAFGSNFSAAFYPKFAASWVVDEGGEDLISQLRLRGAWGRAGQQPDVFSAIQTYTPVVGYNGQGGVTPQNIGNPDLKPEIGEEIEVGLDAGLWNGRVGLEFTYYDKKVKDAILTVPIKPSRGFPGNQFTNIGGTKNSGFEVALDVSPINSENTGLDFRFVYATNNAEITDLGGTPPVISPGNTGSFIQQYYAEGYAPAGYWYKEVVSSTITTIPVGGVPLPIGLNPMCKGGTLIAGSSVLGVADGSVVPCADAPQLFQGAATPTWSGSFSTNLRLGKHLQFLGVVDYLGGHVVQVGDVSAQHHFFWSSKAILNGESEVLSGRLGAQLLNGDGGQTWGMSGLFKGGFMKLRTVAATWDLPRGVVGWIGASRGSITLAGENLAILWRAQKDNFGVEWIDPEISPNLPFGGPGTDTYTQESWPQLMRFRGTIRLTF